MDMSEAVSKLSQTTAQVLMLVDKFK